MTPLEIAGRRIGPGSPTFVVAELSANHGGVYQQAEALVRAAAAAGADAVKLQTYTPDTLTIDVRAGRFVVGDDTLWGGAVLYDLYARAQTPWDWHAPLQALARSLDLAWFSTPFDRTAVEFLESLGTPVYKIASFELVDTPLLRRVAGTGKPMILSTGMATLEEIDEAVATIRTAGATQFALLRTNSAYPAPPDGMHLRTIPALRDRYDVPIGLSDHTLTSSIPVAAVALGASIIEKHLTL
jgi:N-acetylneuraminate synthase